jgi:hypothetical protein
VWRHVRDDPQCFCEDRRVGRGTETLDQARLPLPSAQRRCVRAHHPSPDRTTPVTDAAAIRSQAQSITLNVFESVPPPTQPSTRPTTRARRRSLSQQPTVGVPSDGDHFAAIGDVKCRGYPPPRRNGYVIGALSTSLVPPNSCRSCYAAEIFSRDGSALAKAFVTSHIWSERPCFRPLGAVCMTAGTVSWKRSDMLFTKISRPIFQCRGMSSDDQINPWKSLSALA